MKKIMIYGCYGYTGKLIVDLAVKANLPILLAGRDEAKVKEMATAYNLPFQVFAAENETAVAAEIKGFGAVLNCAGPFARTAKAFILACIEEGVHYLDITGEYQVFELAATYNQKAKIAYVMLLPGVGFDVVPSDCLANHLKSLLPDATQLEMVLYTKGGQLSHGTAITVTENLGFQTMIRKGGKLVEVPNGQLMKTISLDGKQLQATAISWGDISTAFQSTHIPDITIYNALPPAVIKSMRFSNYIGFILKNGLVQRYLKNKIKQRPAGPNEEQRANAKTYIWGEVKNAKGETKTAYLQLPEGYTLTAVTAVEIAKQTIEGHFKTGFQTPATAYGKDFIMGFEGVKRVEV